MLHRERLNHDSMLALFRTVRLSLLLCAYPGQLQAQHTEGMERWLFAAPHVERTDFLYAGIDNPLDIVIPGVECSALSCSVSAGSISGTGCAWVLRPVSIGGLLFLSVTWDQNGRKDTLTKEFWVRPLPEPVTRFAGATPRDSTIPVAHAKAGGGVLAVYEDQRLNIIAHRPEAFDVHHYRLSLFRNAVVYFTAEGRAAITGEMRGALSGVRSDDELHITDIQARDEVGVVMVLEPIKLRVR